MEKILRFDRNTAMEYNTCLEGVYSGLREQIIRWSINLIFDAICKENLENLLTSKLGDVIVLTTKLGKEML